MFVNRSKIFARTVYRMNGSWKGGICIYGSGKEAHFIKNNEIKKGAVDGKIKVLKAKVKNKNGKSYIRG